jgi:hypothetical protein
MLPPRGTRDIDMRPMGWLISVQAVECSRRPMYATVGQSYEQAKLQVFNHCSLTNEVLRLERILADEEIKRIGLQPGEVKLYAV